MFTKKIVCLYTITLLQVLIVQSNVLATTRFNSRNQDKTAALEIEQAKAQLEKLNVELVKLDDSDYTWPCKIGDKDYDKCSERETKYAEQLYYEKQKQKEIINSRIAQILALTFVKQLDFTLGQYNAASQQLPVIFKNLSPGFLHVSATEADVLNQNAVLIKVNVTTALQLNNLNRAKEYLLGAQLRAPDNKVYEVQIGEMTESLAMRMFYGNYEPKSKSARWHYASNASSDQKQNLQEYKAEIIFFKQYRENDSDRLALVTSSFYNDCGSCGAMIGAANFVKQSGIWKFAFGQRYLGDFGYHGNPPEFDLKQIGKEKFALAMKSFYMNHGITSEHLTFFVDHKMIYKKILATQISYDNADSLPDPETSLSYDSQISYVPNVNSEYFDVSVKSTGEKGVRVGREFVVRRFASIRKYGFVNNSYKLIEGKEFD